jgi:multidrug efflux pump subunit AcrB
VISVAYPGASPEEVEQGIVLAVEESVRGIDGVKRVKSSAGEGVANVYLDLTLEADTDRVLSDVKAAIDRIQTFPEDAERPQVIMPVTGRQVVSLVIYGDQDLRALHAVAEKARTRLIQHPDVTQVSFSGVPPLEMSIEVPRENLEALGLTLDDVARQIRATSLELGGGALKTEAGEILVRIADRATESGQFADMVLRGTAGGATVRLGDVATIIDGYADTDQAAFYAGFPAVRVDVSRIGKETPQKVSAATKQVRDALRAELPETVQFAIWNDQSDVLDGRIDLLLKNAKYGGLMVLIVLALFLEPSLAFWVALGIPISFMGAFLLMPGLDLSINMITLFALIITLGMVVDDAIVVGENAFGHMQRGLSKSEAAILGAKEMAVPVTFAILTTLAAFSPMFFVPGVMGKIFGLFPAVVISVLLFSLLESFFILPAHLAHFKERRWIQILSAPQKRVGRALERFIADIYTPFLDRVLHWRYAAVATAIALFLLTIGVLGSGIVAFSFFPKIEGDLVVAAIRLPYGAPKHQAVAVLRQLEEAVPLALEHVGEPDILRGMFSQVGEGPPTGFGPPETGGHLITVSLFLVGAGDRETRSSDLGAAWRTALPPLAGVESLVISSASGPGAGSAVEMNLAHDDVAVLAEASESFQETLRGYSDLTNVNSTFTLGKPRLDFHLRDNAATLGLTGQDVARQVRSAFYGAESVREQRGRNELKIMVRLPADQRASEFDLGQLQIRTGSGAFAPLASVAEYERSRAPTTIKREDGRRSVNVSADLAFGVKSAQDVLSDLESSVIPALWQKYPDLKIEKAGEQKEQAETFQALGQNYLLALFAIFALLAVPFRSYTQPLIIMSAIPFGLVGAVGGHLIMGYEMSLISMFGIVALSGVVVNDSLVLIDRTNKNLKQGMDPRQAIVAASARRFRPIMLTSLTTFFGLAPMILETSMQARFLIPMAISLGFGVLFATVLILLVVPSLFMVLEDVTGITNWLGGRIGRLFGVSEPSPSDAAA